MALKALMAKRSLELKKKQLEELRAKDADFAKREEELEKAIAEVETDEEKETVTAEIEQLENDKTAHTEATEALEAEIEQLEGEIADAEKKQEESLKAAVKPETRERKEVATMDINKRTKFFGLTVQERDAFINDEKVQELLGTVRAIGKGDQTRAVSGADLLIPDNMLGLIRENIENYSKLIGLVDMRRVKGTSRINIAGGIPEAIWTEACGKLNELDLKFYQTEVEGAKVGGFIAICNATLEDSDLALATEIINAIGKSIGYAIDKAILYGTGIKMPTGIVTRLAEASKPSGYSVNDRPWADLRTTNLLTIASSSKAQTLYQEIILASGNVSDKYARGNMFWIMNKKTKNYLTAQALTINAAGAIVSGQQNTMPIVGGNIVELDFVPDDNIIVGYGENYLLVERSSTAIASSTEYKFLDDITVFKGTARYDGKPVIPEAFAVIGINGATPTTSIPFPQDTANASTQGAA